MIVSEQIVGGQVRPIHKNIAQNEAVLQKPVDLLRLFVRHTKKNLMKKNVTFNFQDEDIVCYNTSAENRITSVEF